MSSRRIGDMDWSYPTEISPKRYLCSYCQSVVAAHYGMRGHKSLTESNSYVYVCPNCGQATFFDVGGAQFPAPVFGEQIRGVSDESVARLYNEARHAFGAGSNTAVVLSCRVLLMHVAKSLGAKSGDLDSFQSTVEYLRSAGHITSKSVGWVDAIRKLGNDANHDIIIMSKEQAETILLFTEMLLRTNYEYPDIADNLTKSKS